MVLFVVPFENTVNFLQWNPNIMMYQGTGKITLLYRGIVKPGFRSIHFTVTLAGLKNVNRYIRNIVLSKIVISRFHCI